MDSIFLPDSKHWIFQPYPFPPSPESTPNENDTVSSGPQEEGTSDGVDGANNINMDLASITLEQDLLNLNFGDEESDVGQFIHPGDVKVVLQTAESEETCDRKVITFDTETPSTSRQVEGGIRKVEAAAGGDGDGSRVPAAPADSCPPRKRRKKQMSSEPQVVEEEKEVESWDKELQRNLGMSDEEFEEFKKSQGFDNQSAKLHSLFDFGIPEPKGMPRFATKIDKDAFEHSNALRIYHNALLPSFSYGSLILNATDQAFFQPTEGKPNSKIVSSKDQIDPKDMIVTVDCYHPSSTVTNYFSVDLGSAKLPVVSVTAEILASQTLADLQSRLHCENDFVYTDQINHPREAKKLDWKKCACIQEKDSVAIFINDTIYTPDVEPNYGQVVSKWVGHKFLKNPKKFETGLLTTKLKNTGFRPGYPYLYWHNNCEHLLVFTNVRTLGPNDPRSQKMYPRVTFMHNLPRIRCRVNPVHSAKFVVKNNPLLPEPIVALCTDCCMQFCYKRESKGGQDIKVGSFELYPLIQKSLLPISHLEM